MVIVSMPFPSPMLPVVSRAELLVGYLDFFRTRIVEKVSALPEAERRSSRSSSGWTPIELVRHLTFVERRWLVWGFLGQDIGDPWGDRPDGRWFVVDDEQSAEVLGELDVVVELAGSEQEPMTRPPRTRHSRVRAGDGTGVATAPPVPPSR